MGITKTLKNKLHEQQGYQVVGQEAKARDEVQKREDAAIRRAAIVKKHETGHYMTAFIVFIIGLVFVRIPALSPPATGPHFPCQWSCCANIATSALLKVYPNETGNPRSAPLLNFGICGLGILNSVMAVAWLWKRGSALIFLAVSMACTGWLLSRRGS